MKQEPDNVIEEKIVTHCHHHWIVLIIPTLLYLSTLSLVSSAALIIRHQIELLTEIKNIIYLISFLILIITTHYYFIFVIAHFLKHFMVTDKRIIVFDYLPYYKHNIDFLELKNIYEVQKKKNGFFKNLFDYGSVMINTIGKDSTVLMNNLPKPGKFANTIGALIHTEEDKKRNTKINEIKENYQ